MHAQDAVNADATHQPHVEPPEAERAQAETAHAETAQAKAVPLVPAQVEAGQVQSEPAATQPAVTDPLAAAHAQIADAAARIAALSERLENEARSRLVREALEDAGAVRLRDATRVADQLLARAGTQGSAADTPRDLAGVVAHVREAHPEFFAHSSRWPSTAAGTSPAPDASLDGLATRARASNDRRALLEYLRARRAR